MVDGMDVNDPVAGDTTKAGLPIVALTDAPSFAAWLA